MIEFVEKWISPKMAFCREVNRLLRDKKMNKIYRDSLRYRLHRIIMSVDWDVESVDAKRMLNVFNKYLSCLIYSVGKVVLKD